MKNIMTIFFILLANFCCFTIGDFELNFSQPVFADPKEFQHSDERRKYALLIGGGSNPSDHCESFHDNILYFYATLKKMGYKDEDIRILSYNGKNLNSLRVIGAATKKEVLNELNRLGQKIDSNDSLVIFRSGHGIIKLIFENHGILANDEELSKIGERRVIGTAAVMIFPDGYLSYLEFQMLLKKIKGKQIIVILNQCYAGQFTNMASNLDNILIISETAEAEIAFKKKQTNPLTGNVWPFVKCLCDGFSDANINNKQPVLNAFHFMLNCHPNVKGVPIKADRPLWKITPQIRYGSGLSKGSVFID